MSQYAHDENSDSDDSDDQDVDTTVYNVEAGLSLTYSSVIIQLPVHYNHETNNDYNHCLSHG